MICHILCGLILLSLSSHGRPAGKVGGPSGTWGPGDGFPASCVGNPPQEHVGVLERWVAFAGPGTANRKEFQPRILHPRHLHPVLTEWPTLYLSHWALLVRPALKQYFRAGRRLYVYAPEERPSFTVQLLG